jgi:hypothetical protein
MVLSLSPGPTSLAHAEEVASLAQMWRISDDVWDVWASDKPFPRSVKSQFASTAAWAPLTHAGAWPDADMLPLGELRPHPDVGPGPRSSRLSAVEQRTLMTLWCMARSPLILGANLTLLDAPTLALITDPGLLRIDQHALASRQVLREGDLVAWTADLPDGERALAMFNLGDSELAVSRNLAAFGLVDSYRVMGSGQAGGASASVISRSIPAHGSVVLYLRH